MAGTKGRPAPPGRPRSSQQLQSRQEGGQYHPKSRSPLGQQVNLEDEEGSPSHPEQSSSGLGLSLMPESPTMTDIEIPLEAVESALRDLSRDDLVLALKRAKEQMDIVSCEARTE